MKTTAIIMVFAATVFIANACSDSNNGNNNQNNEAVGGEDTGLDVRALVEALASDEMEGRDNLSAGSLLAQELLFDELSRFAQPMFDDAEGIDGYLQPYDVGTNVLAMIPGGDLADEYVMIGAHYDHHGRNCADSTEDDNICNGANDNATGVAAVINIVKSIVADGTPRRSIIITLWDGEEDGLVGARYYAANPAIPLEQTIAYVNFDIQGANLLPSLREHTILVGAETGGENLVQAAQSARKQSSLDTVMLSLLFGQGRSDHAALVDAGVPSVFFTDANNGCYHTVKDDIDAVDFPKLEQQILTANALTRDLIDTDDVPVFDASAPVATYADASELLRIVEAAQEDFGRFSPEQQVASEQYLIDLKAIVDAGPAAFDQTAFGTLLSGAAALVATLASQECDPFILED